MARWRDEADYLIDFRPVICQRINATGITPGGVELVEEAAQRESHRRAAARDP